MEVVIINTRLEVKLIRGLVIVTYVLSSTSDNLVGELLGDKYSGGGGLGMFKSKSV